MSLHRVLAVILECIEVSNHKIDMNDALIRSLFAATSRVLLPGGGTEGGQHMNSPLSIRVCTNLSTTVVFDEDKPDQGQALSVTGEWPVLGMARRRETLLQIARRNLQESGAEKSLKHLGGNSALFRTPAACSTQMQSTNMDKSRVVSLMQAPASACMLSSWLSRFSNFQ